MKRSSGERVAYWLARAAHSVQRAGYALETFTSAAAETVLSAEQKRAITARVYDGLAPKTELFAWERPWFQRMLPAAPARILVGGCGHGREMRALIAQGYEVWGFDPSLESARACAAEVAGAAFVGWFGYEALSANVLEGAPEHRQLLPAGLRFDAVLLGWGSLTQVIDEAEQRRALQALDRLAPEGPLLASFYLAPTSELPPGRAALVGARLGHLLRGRVSSATQHPRVRFGPRTGFTYSYDEPRLQALAADCGRQVVVERDTTFAHGVFLPAGAKTRACRDRDQE